MSSDMDARDECLPLVQELITAASGVEKDDLAKLAKMHSLVESLLTVPDLDVAASSTGLRDSLSGITHHLEGLILGEAADLDAELIALIKIVDSLGVAVPGGDSAVPEAPAATATDAAATDDASVADHADDEDVAAKLAHIFDDEPVKEVATGDDGVASEPAVVPEDALPETSAVVETDQQTSDEGASADSVPAYESEPLTVDPSELEFVQGFVEEALEHVEAIETAVLGVESAPDDPSNIDNLFRPFHTIKGMAGFLNFRDVNCLAHEAETLLDQGRKGERAISSGLIDLIFDVVDILKLQIAEIGAYAESPGTDPVPQPPVAEMIEKLRKVVAGQIEPEGHKEPGGSPNQKVGENLVSQRACPQEAVDFAVEKQKQQGDGKKVGEVLVDMGVATPRQVSQAIRPQVEASGVSVPASAPKKPKGSDVSVRIDTAKLDALVDMVGELVIAQTQVCANPIVGEHEKLERDVNQAVKISRDVQAVAMSMRMVTIGSTFQKMARLVRDVSRKAGKTVELVISGEDTELDKNVIQQIGDPLVHMVRNAVDHGVESPQARAEAGKEETGHVHLSAGHRGGNVVIEIRDDGKGLDPQALIAKAVEKGVIKPGDDLTDQQAYQLIFAAGFSTAAEVTDISGRGVGMDVVRRNIEQLRGKVEITSEIGKGSTFTICLPLTLAIIDGMIVRVGSERFVMPTIAIEQSLRPRREQISTVQHRGEMLNVRGKLIPLVQLGALFGLTKKRDPCETMVIVTNSDGRQIGLVVDELIGQQQVVIKSLGEKFKGLQGVSGAAVLGDGRVGLILEMSGIVTAHESTTLMYRDDSLGLEKRGSEKCDSEEDGLEAADADDVCEDACSESECLLPA